MKKQIDDSILALAAFVKEGRENLGLTQEELANLIGLSEVSVNRLEKGKVDPKYSVLLKISDVLSLSLSELFLEIDQDKWKGYKKMSDGDKALVVMKKMAANNQLPAHWKKVEAEFQANYGYKPKDFNQVLADLSHEEHCDNYPSIGRPVFERVQRGTYTLI